MACWICTFGSAYSSTLELNSAMRYFHALTNGLAMSSFRLRFVLSARVGSGGCRYVPTYRFRGRDHTPAEESASQAQATAMDTTCGMTTLVLTSMFVALTVAASAWISSSCSIVSPALVSTRDSGTSRAPQMAPSSSLEASLRPRSTSERYPRLTRAASDTSRRVRPCSILARRSTSPITSRSNAVIALSSQQLRHGHLRHPLTPERPHGANWFPQGGKPSVTSGTGTRVADGRDDVVDARDHGQHDGRPHDHPRPDEPDSGQRQDEEPDRDRLDQGLELAAPTGRDHATAKDGEAQRRDADLTDEHHPGHPPGQVPEHRQADERRADQCLVGDRIGELPELGDQVVASGNPTV